MPHPCITACSLFIGAVIARADGASKPYRIEHHQVSACEFIVALPPDYQPGDRPALVVCLHGTNTDANDILTFWLTMKGPYPMLFVAPQSSGPGWRDTDAAGVFAAVDWVRDHLSVDWSRVLLTGHSAGGTMTIHLIYERAFPATAAATTANYLPPSVTGPMIQKRADLPVFYAVGTRDLNRERMRAGIVLLRSNGTLVAVQRPEIGHVLDRDVTQQALDFFVKHNSHDVQATIREALAHFSGKRPAIAAGLLQRILDGAAYHHSDDVAEVEAALDRIEQPGRKQLAHADSLIAEERFPEARQILRRIEKDYTGGRLARQCAALRKAKLPAETGTHAEALSKQDLEKKARPLFDKALELTRQRKFQQAKEKCRILLADYKETRSAQGAQRLLQQLELISGP